MNVDILLLHALNDLVGTFPPLDWLARMLVNDYAVPTLCALFLGALWFAGDSVDERDASQRAVLYALVGIVFAMAAIKDFQLIYFRSRPFATEEVKLLFYRPSVSSFPSVPIATLFCYVAAVWRWRRPWLKWFLVPALLFGLARVYAGVHYPSDILGGAFIGMASTLIPIRLRVFENLIERVIGMAELFQLG